MAKVRKFILVTASHMPQHKYFLQILDTISRELGVEKEVREEDYAFLAEYGEKDEFEMPWTPQLLAELDDGRIVPVLTKLPINEKTLQIDLDAALKNLKEKLRSLSVEA